MKRCLLISLVVMSLAAIVLPTKGHAQNQTDVETVVLSTNQFAVDLYQLLKKDNENLFFSPYGIYTVLALIYAGADGETAEQMANALHVRLESKNFHPAMVEIRDILKQIQQTGDVELNIANALWPQTGAPLVPEFLVLAEEYLAEVYPVDYRSQPEAVRKQINTWAEQKTKGNISEIINWTLHPETHLLLANAIFFKGSWARRFAEDKTDSMPFHLTAENTIDVPMMRQIGDYAFGATDNAHIVELPYQGDTLSMIIVLPRSMDGLHLLEEGLTTDTMAAWQNSLSNELVELHLPRFEIMSDFDLVQQGSLRSLGIVRALDERQAEFPGIAALANWFSIQRFIHKAFVNVNEEGTEAAAVTVGGCFPAETLVLTPNGSVPIKAVEPGTPVYAFHLTEKKWVTTKVVALQTYPFSGDMITIRTGSDSIRATWNHPFLITQGVDLGNRPQPIDLPEHLFRTGQGRWVQAGDLKVGDKLLAKNDADLTVTGLSRTQLSTTVYNLEVDGIHNYAIGQKGVLVHNEKEGSAPELMVFQADHPFLFYIRDNITGSILFIGRVTNPAAK